METKPKGTRIAFYIVTLVALIAIACIADMVLRHGINWQWCIGFPVVITVIEAFITERKAADHAESHRNDHRDE